MIGYNTNEQQAVAFSVVGGALLTTGLVFVAVAALLHARALQQRTQQQKRQLAWFGVMVRLPDGPPAGLSLSGVALPGEAAP